MARQRKNVVAHLDGADELNAALRRMRDRAAGRILRDAANAGADIIVAEAAKLAPRDTGLLAENIDDRAIRKQFVGRAQLEIGPTRTAWYGALLERGTSKMAARPFLRPALHATKDRAVAAVRAVLKKLIT